MTQSGTGAMTGTNMGLQVLVTRPEPQASQWVGELGRALDAPDMGIHALPLIAIQAPADPHPVALAWQHLAREKLLMFVSPAAVEWFFRLRPVGARWPEATLAAAPGPGTARSLLAAGAPVGLTPASILSPGAEAAQFDSEALWPLLAPLNWQSQHITVISGGDDSEAKGRTWLAEQWRQRGAQVASLLTYQRGPGHWRADQQALAREALTEPARHIWLFSSSQAIDFLIHDHLPGLLLTKMPDWARVRAIVTHPKIAEKARAMGMHRLTASRPTMEAVVEALRSPA